MLARIYGLLHKHNPELTQRKRTKLKPPQVYRVGSTRTCWANFTQICNMYVERGSVWGMECCLTSDL